MAERSISCVLMNLEYQQKSQLLTNISHSCSTVHTSYEFAKKVYNDKMGVPTVQKIGSSQQPFIQRCILLNTYEKAIYP